MCQNGEKKKIFLTGHSLKLLSLELATRVFQIIQYSFYRHHLLEFTVSWGKEAPYQKLNLRKIN